MLKESERADYEVCLISASAKTIMAHGRAMKNS